MIAKVQSFFETTKCFYVFLSIQPKKIPQGAGLAGREVCELDCKRWRRQLLRNGRGRDTHAPRGLQMLFHCDFYVFLANLGDYDRAGLCGEGCCAVDGGGGAEGFAIYAIEADLLVVVEAGDVDETTG